MSLSKRQICDWLAGLADPETIQAVEEDLRAQDQSVTAAWLTKLGETSERLERLAESGAISRWLDEEDNLDIPQPPATKPNVASDTSSSQHSIDDFVQREVLRLLNTIENSSSLLGRKDLRWFRDNIVEAARAAKLLSTAEDDRVLHVALLRSIRPVRRENAMVTFKSGLGKPKQIKRAQKLLNLLDAQDRILADLRDDEEFAHVALWYQLVEDAGLSVDEVAALWGEDAAIIRKALKDPQAEIQVEWRRID